MINRLILAVVVVGLGTSVALAEAPPRRAASDGTAAAPTPLQVLDSEAGSGSPQVEEQNRGRFGPMDRPSALPLGMIQRAWDKAPPEMGILHIPHNPNTTPKLRVRFGMPLTIVLPEGERIPRDGLILGSAILHEVMRAGNRFTIEARDIGADTTVTVYGASGRTYVMYVRTEDYKSAFTPDLLAIFDGPPVTPLTPLLMPGEAAPAGGGALAVPDIRNPSVAARLNFGFEMAGDPSIAPDQVYSDNRFIYLYWVPARWQASDLPSVYRVVDRIDEPVQPPEVVGSTLIVKVFGALSLRSGTRTVCIRPIGPQPTDRPNTSKRVGEL